MAEAPKNVALASGFVAAPAAGVWQQVSDIAGWPQLFPGWTASIEAEDDRFTATGPRDQRFDIYPNVDDEHFALDAETVDELGSADTLRLRLVSAKGGCFVVVTHGRLNGMPDAEWDAKRDGIAQGLTALAAN
jgi:hypothetical protein